MSEHAKLSPSAFGRWGKCPASVHLSKDIKDTTSPAASWGTDAHEMLEIMLEAWLANEHPMLSDVDDFEEKKEVAEVALDYVVNLYNEAEAAGINPTLQVEAKVYTEYYTGRDDLWGSADVIIETDLWIEIIDLKAGRGILVMPDTGQLKIYALGAMAPQAKLNKGVVPWKEVRCTIVQPRIPHPDGVIRTEVYTSEWLETWCREVLVPACKATEYVEGEKLVFNPGVEQCRFCKVAKCSGRDKKATEFVMSVFEDQSDKTLTDVVSATPDMLTIEKMVEINEAAPLITGWLKAIEAHLKDQLKGRKPVPGYKLVKSGQCNSWSKPDTDILDELSKGKGRITKSQLTVDKVISAPQALKLKDLSDVQRKRLQSYVVKSEGSLAMVPVSDGRPDAFPPVQFNDMSFLD